MCKVYKNENLVHIIIICALFGTKVHTTAGMNNTVFTCIASIYRAIRQDLLDLLV